MAAVRFLKAEVVITPPRIDISLPNLVVVVVVEFIQLCGRKTK